ncbi:MAG: hypothetical protein IKA47_11510 [Oscillospiraceae bacterium]|nr:hypothetical protein [Oscillospiraceae bacterium]
MRKLKTVSILFALLILLSLPVMAAQTGSLVVRNVKSPAVMYLVADANGVPTQDFAIAITENLTEDRLTPDAARKLQTHAEEKNLSGQTVTPDSSNLITFSLLEEGCYLVCSTAQPGEFAPFLIRVPMTIGDKLVYDIQASPKVDPNNPNAPGKPVEPQPNIPQTGNIQWPKYLLLILGGVAILAGFVEVLRGREKTYE